MRHGGVAFASAEDEWAAEDEDELTGPVPAGADADDDYVSGSHLAPVIRLVPRARVLRVPLWDLEAKGLKITFRDALMVELEQEDGEGVLLESADLRIWGLGKDTFAALEDFSATFVAVLQSYEATPAHQLSPDAVQYLERMRALIAKREAIQSA